MAASMDFIARDMYRRLYGRLSRITPGFSGWGELTLASGPKPRASPTPEQPMVIRSRLSSSTPVEPKLQCFELV